MAEADRTGTEDLLLQIEEELLELTVEDLKKFAEYIKIPKEKYDVSKLKVLRVIRSKMEEEIEELGEFLEDIRVYFTKEPPDLEGETAKDEKTDNSERKDQDKAEVVKVNVKYEKHSEDP